MIPMEKRDLKVREDEIVRMVAEFCKERIDAEYAGLCVKMVRKLGRKKTSPLERGRLEIGAAAVIYTVATVNFLFDKSFEPYIPSSEIFDHFGVSSSTISQKSSQIRTMLKIRRYWDADFSTKYMQANNPFELFYIL